MREIRIHDTLSGGERKLEPRDPPKVGIYACGPTVYGRVHVGNARPYVVFSLLKRFLEHEGYDATFVANVTDVNDKIYDAARERGIPSEELAREMTDAYVADTDLLGLGRPDHEPKASETIDAIVDADRGADRRRATPTRRGGDVYFRVASFDGYGKLSNRPLEEMQQGEGDDAAEVKEAPQDFALWKARKEGEDTCVAVALGRRPARLAHRVLGDGGGAPGRRLRDPRRRLGPGLPPPRERDRADRGRPRAAAGAASGCTTAWSRWRDEKMAKSVGNIRLLHGAIEQFGRDAFVMWIVGAHYRQPIAYTEETLADAAPRRRPRPRADPATRRRRGRAPAELDAIVERFFDHLADDFNTPPPAPCCSTWVAEANRRIDAGERLGPGRLGEMLHAFGLERLSEGDTESAPEDVERLAAEREEARDARDFERADRLRDELAARGWEVRDTAEGPRLVRT